MSLFKNNKKHIYTFIVALILWGVTFFTDRKIFSSDELNMNCLPVDTSMVTFMHVMTKILVFLCLFLFLEFLVYARKHPKLLIPFLVFMAIYIVGLLLTYPGYYMSDDSIIFGYATRYYPVYWHNYLTSLFYTTAISLFPASCGPVLLSDVLYALTYAYLYYRADNIYHSKWCRLLLVAGVLPFTLLGALMCFRPAVYSSFFLFYFIYLYFERKEQAPATPAKLILLAFLTAILSLWRSESIVLLPAGLLLIGLTYHSGRFFTKGAMKQAFLFFLIAIVFYTGVKLPQSMGEKKYYGSDYLIISTTRPLSVIVHREQTYEGSEADLANISAITDFGYLHNDSLSCSAYNRYNSDHNEGRYTQTGASDQLQKAYLKSALRLILNNFDLYLGERIQLFFVTNEFFDYDPGLVLNLTPVVTTGFHLYEHDRSFGFDMLDTFKRIPVSYHENYALFLFDFGGEAYIPMLLVLFAMLVISIAKRNWFLCFSFLVLFAREAVIFLTAPASFIQYSYPMMYVTAALGLIMIVDKMANSGADTLS